MAKVSNMDGADRARALGRELVLVHQSLRAELRRVRRELEAGGDAGVRPGDLRAHCAAFCMALTKHHTSEDRAAFPALRKEFPELGDVLTELERDHVLIADILRNVQRILDDFQLADADRAKRELDGLAAIMESHFQWEERKLVAVLDRLRAPGSSAEDLFGISSERA